VNLEGDVGPEFGIVQIKIMRCGKEENWRGGVAAPFRGRHRHTNIYLLEVKFRDHRSQPQLRDLAAPFARGFAGIFVAPQSEGARMPGADAPAAVDLRVVRATVTPETPGIPAQWFIRLLRDLPGDDCATVACGTDRKLDTSVKDIRTTRLGRPLWQRSSRVPPRPTAAHPYVRDVRETPLRIGTDAVDIA
jgi:hypothetical protein